MPAGCRYEEKLLPDSKDSTHDDERRDIATDFDYPHDETLTTHEAMAQRRGGREPDPDDEAGHGAEHEANLGAAVAEHADDEGKDDCLDERSNTDEPECHGHRTREALIFSFA